MAKRIFELQSRSIFVSQKKTQFAELFDMTINCDFSDDADAGNDFDITVLTDLARNTELVAYDTSEIVNTEIKGTAIEGSISTVLFTRTSGIWTTNALKGWRCFAYINGAEESGTWHEIASNTTTGLTSETAFASGVNRIKIQPRTIRHNIQLFPKPGLYGSFFKHTITKTIPSDGNFRVFDVYHNLIPVNLDPEFVATMSAVANAWE